MENLKHNLKGHGQAKSNNSHFSCFNLAFICLMILAFTASMMKAQTPDTTWAQFIEFGDTLRVDLFANQNGQSDVEFNLPVPENASVVIDSELNQSWSSSSIDSLFFTQINLKSGSQLLTVKISNLVKNLVGQGKIGNISIITILDGQKRFLAPCTVGVFPNPVVHGRDLRLVWKDEKPEAVTFVNPATGQIIPAHVIVESTMEFVISTAEVPKGLYHLVSSFGHGDRNIKVVLIQ